MDIQLNVDTEWHFLRKFFTATFCKPHVYVILLTRLFVILLTTFFCKHHTFSLDFYSGDLQTRNFTQNWLNYYWLVARLFCLFICARLQSAERSCSLELYRNRLYMCIFILVCPSCLLWLGYLEVCICVHSASCCSYFCCVFVILSYPFHVHDLCFCSFCLLFLMLNDIRSFPFL